MRGRCFSSRPLPLRLRDHCGTNTYGLVPRHSCGLGSSSIAGRTVINLIQRGEEGPHVLSFAGTEPTRRDRGRSASPGRSWSKVGSEKKSSLQEKQNVSMDLFPDEEDWDKEVEKQKAILESLVPPGGEKLPEWAMKPPTAPTRIIPVALPGCPRRIPLLSGKNSRAAECTGPGGNPFPDTCSAASQEGVRS